MKALIKTVWFVGLASLGLQSHCPAQQERDFATMTLDQAEAAINQTDSGQVLLEFVNSALSSKRLDLIDLCIANQYARTHLYTAAKHLTDRRFKAQVVVLMLRAGVGFWPPDEYDIGFFPKPSLEEPIKGILTAYFPTEKFGDESIGTRASRLALADRLVSVVGTPTKTAPHASSLPPALLQGEKQSTPAAHASVPEASQQIATPGAQTSAIPSERRAPVWPWVIGILAFIVIVALIFRRAQGQL